MHLQNNIGCTDCHDPHNPKESQFLMKRPVELLLCFKVTAVAKLRLFFLHPPGQ